MSFRYFENHSCEYYPCHDVKDMNCLFCFCPLYFWDDCGGSYTLIEDQNGRKIKDCSRCVLPHQKAGYDVIIEKLKTDDGREVVCRHRGEEWL